MARFKSGGAMNSYRFAGPLAALGCLVHPIGAAPPTINKLPSTIAEAKTADQAAAIVRSRLALRGKEFDSVMMTDKSLALFHVWDQCVRKLTGSTTKDDRARLVGRVEGLLGVSCPQGWIEIVYASDPPFTAIKHSDGVKYHEIGAGWKSRSPELVMDDDVLSVKSGRELTRLWQVPFSRILTESIEYTRTADQSQYLLAFPPTGSRPYEIVLVERGSEKVRWQSTVLSSSVVIESGGQPYHYAWPIIERSRCIVFGADSYALYIKAFDIETGKPLIRFNSGFWDADYPKRTKK